jgi:ATP-dependent helicase HepA
LPSVRNQFVRISHEKYETWGIGKLVELDEETAVVEFFDSPVEEKQRVEIPSSFILAAAVPRQTRAYWHDEIKNVWRVGRVLEHYGNDIELRFPGKDGDAYLSVEDVFIRWNKRLVRPQGYLANFINETPRFSDARAKFTKAITSQRAASFGMPALLSSAIDLEIHQIEIVRRVLQDPVQRYLLADEVGLGKTIEAGILLRQYALDEPNNHAAVVIVPDPLVRQWEHEIRDRFKLYRELSNSIHVIGHSDRSAIKRHVNGAGMLIIDEAHHVSENPDLSKLLISHTFQTPRLLLLSATPVLGNEEGFLGMLRLLDPDIYANADPQEFKSQIRNRQSLAEIVAGLVPENLLQLDDFIERLCSLFPSDEVLQSLATELQSIVDEFPDEWDPTFLEALNALRSHVSEAYRLDRRILRNRRRSVQGLTPERSGYVCHALQAPGMERLYSSLEEFRQNALLSTDGADADRNTIQSWYFDLVNCLLTRVPMKEILSRCLADTQRIEKITGTGSLRIIESAIRALDPIEPIISCLNKILEQINAETKIVAFCSEPIVAKIIYEHFSETEPASSVTPFLIGCSNSELDDSVKKFHNEKGCRLIICDHSAEEGLNLQGGEKIVCHIDQPLSPNRIEQRMGRVDRYGTGSKIASHLLFVEQNPIEKFWVKVTSEELKIFDRSVASLQYFMDENLANLEREIFLSGHEAISLHIGELGAKADTEFRQIDEQEALDELISPSEELYDDLFDADADWENFRDAVDSWLVDTLIMESVPVSDNPALTGINEVVRYKFSRGRGHQSLVPLDVFLESFADTIDIDAHRSTVESPLSFPYTTRRTTAQMQQSNDLGARLLRYGEPFLEGLIAQTTTDDRGRSVAMWRQRGDYETVAVADLYFRLDFLIEGNLTFAQEQRGDQDSDQFLRALRRQADMTLPPQFRQIWLNSDGEEVKDPRTLALLNEPYLTSQGGDGVNDLNMNWDRWRFARVLEIPQLAFWRDLVNEISEKGFEILRTHVSSDPIHSEKIQEGEKRYRQTQSQLLARKNGMSYHSDADLDAIDRIAKKVLEGAKDPVINLDTIGVTFLSNQSIDYLAMRAGIR